MHLVQTFIAVQVSQKSIPVKLEHFLHYPVCSNSSLSHLFTQFNASLPKILLSSVGHDATHYVLATLVKAAS